MRTRDLAIRAGHERKSPKTKDGPRWQTAASPVVACPDGGLFRVWRYEAEFQDFTFSQASMRSAKRPYSQSPTAFLPAPKNPFPPKTSSQSLVVGS
jgi:hypothetical protein